jgi:hypothetical protein
MKKENITFLAAGLFLVLLTLSSLAFISAYSVTLTTVNSTKTTVNISNAVDLYSYEINFVCNDSGAAAQFYGFLGAAGTTSRGTDYVSNILSVYESKLDNTQTGVTGSGRLFNITHTCNLTLRQGITVASTEVEETDNICTETLYCSEWSSCTGGVQSRTCRSLTCLYPDTVETQNCGTTTTGTTGGGGGGSSQTLIMRIIFDAPIIGEDGKIEIPLSLKNDGPASFSDISLRAVLLRNSKVTEDIVTITPEKVSSLAGGGSEKLILRTTLPDAGDVSFYEIEVNAVSSSPKYNVSNKVLFTFVGKNSAGVLKVVAFTEGLIQEHPECLELKGMIDDAQEEFKSGNAKQAIEKANRAVEACKNYLESPLRPMMSQKGYNKIPIYLGLGIAAAILFGIIFNLYRYYRFYPRFK